MFSVLKGLLSSLLTFLLLELFPYAGVPVELSLTLFTLPTTLLYLVFVRGTSIPGNLKIDDLLIKLFLQISFFILFIRFGDFHSSTALGCLCWPLIFYECRKKAIGPLLSQQSLLFSQLGLSKHSFSLLLSGVILLQAPGSACSLSYQA